MVLTGDCALPNSLSRSATQRNDETVGGIDVLEDLEEVEEEGFVGFRAAIGLTLLVARQGAAETGFAPGTEFEPSLARSGSSPSAIFSTTSSSQSKLMS